MIAIIPAAGLGTRMASVTGGAPKELLPLGHQTVLARIVAEAYEADADEIIVVSSPSKPQLDQAVEEIGDARIRVVHQATPKGLADAILTPSVESDALILLGDCVFHGGSPLGRMGTLVYRGVDGCVAVEEVPESEVSRYGICEVDGMGSIRRMLEKPSPAQTSSRWAVAARYALSSSVMAHLGELYAAVLAQGDSRDVPLTPLLQRAIDSGVELKAVALQPGQQRVDCGTPDEYSAARRLPWD